MIFPGSTVFSTNKGYANGKYRVSFVEWHATEQDIFWLLFSFSLIVVAVFVALIVYYIIKSKKEKRKKE